LPRSLSRAALTAAVAALLACLCFGAAALAAPAPKNQPGGESQELAESIAQFNEQRSAPAEQPSAPGYLAGAKYAAGVRSATTTPWHEAGPIQYQSDDPNYIDPYFSNSGAGAGLVSGRITALAAAADGRTVYAGAADGGVWKSTDAGATWAPAFDDQPTLSIGAVATDPSGKTVWAGTGEANTSSDSYAGVGILKSTDGGASWQQTTGDGLLGALVFRIAQDPAAPSRLFAATSHGLFRSTDGGSSWSKVLGSASDANLAVANMVTDVAIRPGTGGASGDVLAVRGWREGADTNGLYESTDGGGSFTKLNAQGYVSPKSQGRVSLAWSADAQRLYAVVQDPQALLQGKHTILEGVYASRSGSPSGPWTQIASPSKLSNSGSAMKINEIGQGYQPGVQAWYNQWLQVDPAAHDHVYLGLEEVYETTNGGTNWTTDSPYWAFPFSCFTYDPFPGTCQATTHSDQHAAAIAKGTLFVGNDGGVWSRPLARQGWNSWTNLNKTLRTTQFYFAEASEPTAGQLTLYGGLQDNGTAKITPDGYAAQPFGGDGGDVAVDPNNPDNVITEYTNLAMAASNDGGRTWRILDPGDPNARFIAPFHADSKDVNHLVAGGQYVYESTKGFATTQSDWQKVFDQGAGRTTTALDVNGSTTYAAWCGPCNPSFATGQGFKAGIATNAGGSWHQVTPPLTTRYPTAVTIDPANPAHAYVTYSGFSRHWIVGPYDAGVGHVFETKDGGASWTDISGDLVDGPANDVVLAAGKVVVGTDFGAFEASAAKPGTWKVVGSGLPNVVVNDLSVSPKGTTVIAATHGRGIWTIPVSGL
jgi:hypothetical protein